MKPIIQLVTGLIFVLTLTAGLKFIFGIVRGNVSGEGIRGMVAWKSDWNDALADAAARQKPLLVEFSRQSSPNCRDLAKKCWSRLDIADAAAIDYEPVMVDIDAHPDLARQFDIATVPSLIVIDAKTQSIIRDGRDETFSPNELLVWLERGSHPIEKYSIPEDVTLNPQKSLFDTQKSPYAP